VTPTGPAGRCTARRRPRTTFTRARSASEPVGRSRPLVRSATGASNELALTDAGAALVRRLRPEHDEFLAAQFDVLDDDEMSIRSTSSWGAPSLRLLHNAQERRPSVCTSQTQA
jgi:hypothetical protein